MSRSPSHSPMRITLVAGDVADDDDAPVHEELLSSDALAHLRKVRDSTDLIRASNEEVERAIKKMMRIQARTATKGNLVRNETMLHALVARQSRRHTQNPEQVSPLQSPTLSRRGTITFATAASARNSIVESNSPTLSPDASVVYVSPLPKRPSRPQTTGSVHQRLYDSAMEGVSPSFRQLQLEHKTDPDLIAEMNRTERTDQLRRIKAVTRRNMEDLEAVKGIIRGEVDIRQRHKQREERMVAVRDKKLGRERAVREVAVKEAGAKEELRQMKAANSEQVDEFIIRICSWKVMLTLTQSVEAMKHLLATRVKDVHSTRKQWAALILIRSMPVMWRKFVRKRRLIRLGAVMRIVHMIVHRRRLLGKKAINIVKHFFQQLRHDPILRTSRFLRHTMIATKATRTFVMVRRHKTNLVRRQWRAMETYMLLVHPELCMAQEDILKIKLFQRWDQHDNESPYNAVPYALQDYVETEPYFVFLAKWRRHARVHNIKLNEDALPVMLERFLPPPQYNAAFIMDHIMGRQRKVRRVVNNIYSTFLNEKTAARDMMKASQQLRKESAVMDVKRKYPAVNDNTRLFQILVDFEESYAPSPFFQILMSNTNASLVAKLPPIPFVRTLFLSSQLRLLVGKCFHQVQLNRDLATIGSATMPVEKSLAVSMQESKSASSV